MDVNKQMIEEFNMFSMLSSRHHSLSKRKLIEAYSKTRKIERFAKIVNS